MLFIWCYLVISFIWGQVPWRFVQSKLREQVEISVSTNFWYLEIHVWSSCNDFCAFFHVDEAPVLCWCHMQFSQSLNTVGWETNSNHSMKFCTSGSSHSCKHHWMHRFGVSVCLFNHNLNTTQRTKKPLQGISPVWSVSTQPHNILKGRSWPPKTWGTKMETVVWSYIHLLAVNWGHLVSGIRCFEQVQ